MTEDQVGLPYGIIDPKYAAFYTVARLTAWSYGYAIALHGSFTRDLDLIAIPWTDRAVSPDKLIFQIKHRTETKSLKEDPSVKEHGRLVWTLTFPEFGCPRFVDFSIMPGTSQPNDDRSVAVSSRDNAPPQPGGR